MSDSQYLKRYVETHPDNKMAWYLLGKDYARNGEQGKANYCFNRAEEVYEAFELSQVPADVWENYEQRLVEHEKEREGRARSLRRRLLLAVFLLLALVPSVSAPGLPSPEQLALQTIRILLPKPEQVPSRPAPAPVRPELHSGDGMLFTAAGVAKGREGEALSELLSRPARLPGHTVVLGMERNGRWALWSQEMPALYGVARKSSGEISVQPYQEDGKRCRGCPSADDPDLRQSAAGWAEVQLQSAVLSEAIRQFAEERGRPPESLDELVRPFPHNWLSGTSPVMEQLFPHLVNGTGDASKGAVQNGIAPLPGSLGASPDGKPYFAEPLTVVIDRKNHRLAVTSGQVLIRNYKVGLGRDNKTPLGHFRISDKVVNPNGSATGTYGSRGMQLSDTDYAIHGTMDLDSIGGNASEGCIRMFNEDVEELFDLVPRGTKVSIVEGALPDDPAVPEERFTLKAGAGQENPRKIYRWLD